MQTRWLFRRLAQTLTGVALLLPLSACGTADNPYDKITDPPLVEARLHTITLVSDSAVSSARIREAGYTPVTLPANYRGAVEIEASIQGVPEAVAAAAQYFKSSRAGAPDVRLLVMPLAAGARSSDETIDETYFRNVLGTGVPPWPLPQPPSDALRVQAWTFVVPDVVEANKVLRANGIPVVQPPVGLTTSYLGDHRTLAIRAPDGTVVQLVQTTAQ